MHNLNLQLGQGCEDHSIIVAVEEIGKMVHEVKCLHYSTSFLDGYPLKSGPIRITNMHRPFEPFEGTDSEGTLDSKSSPLWRYH